MQLRGYCLALVAAVTALSSPAQADDETLCFVYRRNVEAARDDTERLISLMTHVRAQDCRDAVAQARGYLASRIEPGASAISDAPRRTAGDALASIAAAGRSERRVSAPVVSRPPAPSPATARDVALSALGAVAASQWSAGTNESIVAILDRDDLRGGLEVLAREGDARAQLVLGLDAGALTSEGGRLLAQAAASGNARAQAIWGLIRYALAESDQEMVSGRQLIWSSASQGNAFGQWAKAQTLVLERPSNEVPPEALALIQAAAAQGLLYARTDAAAIRLVDAASAGEAREELLRSGAAGDPRAFRVLGLASASGAGGAQPNPAQAVEYMRRASDAGDPVGMSMLGRMYINGYGGLAPNHPEAIRLLRRAAENGAPEAMGYLGQFLMFGQNGLTRNEVEGLSWLTRGGRYNDPVAHTNLGYVYELGLAGQTQNFPQAVTHYRRAAALGDVFAQTRLADIYSRGRAGVSANVQEARRYLMMAVEAGDANAQALAGSHYEYGRFGFPRNAAEAARLYQLSAAQGNITGEAYLASMLIYGRGVQRNVPEAIRLMSSAAERGHTYALETLGAWYSRGEGVTQSDREARRYWERGVERGGVYSLFGLGVLHLEGRAGFRRNRAEAIRLWRQAVALGSEEAAQALRAVGASLE